MTETMRIKGNGNVGVGTANPQAKLDVMGAIRAGNSDIYFTETNHNHSGIGNATGYAAIENAANYGALMILGRNTATSPNINRVVKLWDYLQVNGRLEVTGSIISPMWKVTQVFERRSGPLPISQSFLSSGGTLIVFFSGTAFRGSGGLFSITVTVDTVSNWVDLYTNEGNSHKTFPSTFFVIRGIAAGSHTLTIAAFANGTLSDANDRYQATVLELPF